MKMTYRFKTETMTDKEPMLSLYDYLGRPAGPDLGKQVAAAATLANCEITRRTVATRTYSGDILMYPKSFLDQYFGSNKQHRL
jgi:hypothetical protein